MIVLYKRRPGADNYSAEGRPESEAHRLLRANAVSLLRKRGLSDAATLLQAGGFEICPTSDWETESYVLYARLSFKRYEKMRALSESKEAQLNFRQILSALEELGVFCQYFGIDLDMQSVDTEDDPNHHVRLTEKEIKQLVWQYIGVEGGYLGSFTYKSHAEFYLNLDLDKDPSKLSGTTRERFIRILSTSTSRDQALILRGISKLFPVGSQPNRTQQRGQQIERWVVRLQGMNVSMPETSQVPDTIEEAIADAVKLIESRGATSGVDRVHTAFHGFLHHVCDSAGIRAAPDSSITDLFSLIREKHPAFAPTGPRTDDVKKVVRSMASIVDVLNPLRNRATSAHPNPELLARAEGMLAINAVLTLYRYVSDKVATLAVTPTS